MAGGSCAWSGASTDEAALSHLEKAYQCGFARLEHASLAGSIVVPI
jgi:hypothetical protein